MNVRLWFGHRSTAPAYLGITTASVDGVGVKTGCRKLQHSEVGRGKQYLIGQLNAKRVSRARVSMAGLKFPCGVENADF
jgi:hypothetical protein